MSMPKDRALTLQNKSVTFLYYYSKKDLMILYIYILQFKF
jgi:hypothetical protein